MTTTLTRPDGLAVGPPDETGYHALRQRAGLIEYPAAGLYHLTGPGASGLIAATCTRDVDFLLEGRSQQSLVLEESGSIVSDVLVHGLSEGYLIQVWPDQAATVGARLAEAGYGTDDVTITDRSDELTVLGVEGPRSYAVVGQYLDFPISSLAFMSSTVTTFADRPLTIVRTGVTGEFGYVLLVPSESVAALRADLIVRGAEPVSRDAVDICRMEMRFPNLEAEIPFAGATPFHVGLQWMVDFSGEFVGKKALLAEESRPMRPVCWQGEPGERVAPSAGTAVEVADASIGTVLHAVYSPMLERCIGLALVDTDCAAVGLTLRIANAPAETVSAPFLVATSFTTTMD